MNKNGTVSTQEEARAKIGTLSAEDQARYKAYSAQMAAELPSANPGAEDDRHEVVHLEDLPERLKCIDHEWTLRKDAPVGMTAKLRTVELNGVHFEEHTGGMWRTDVLQAFYRIHKLYRVQHALYEFDLVVLWAISASGATNLWRVESELAQRRKGVKIYNISRPELYESLERIQKAKLWTDGEMPKRIPAKFGADQFSAEGLSK